MLLLSGRGYADTALFLVCVAVVAGSCSCATTKSDAVSGATSAISVFAVSPNEPSTNALLIAVVSPNGGTAKIAKVIGETLGARVLSPQQVTPEELKGYDLIGFGSGIFDQKHHAELLELAGRLPELPGKKVFIFSTSGVARQVALDNKITDPHTPLRKILESKGMSIVGEFNCAGFNDNSFLKLFGGMNKGKPNAEDLRRAESFANHLTLIARDGGL